MLFTFDVIINPIILLAGIIGGAIVGFGLRKGKLAKIRSKLTHLEAELMSCHQETLESQKAYVALETSLRDQPIPVISMNINGPKENSKEKATK